MKLLQPVNNTYVPGFIHRYMHCFIYDKSTKQFNFISKTFNSINKIEPTIEWLLKHLIECKQNRLLNACF